MHAPVFGARVERACVRFVSRCGGGRSIRPHQCAALSKRNSMMRSTRPFNAAADRILHARANCKPL
eukprot:2147540-Lingulodinium_polyedra.AAC.1